MTLELTHPLFWLCTFFAITITGISKSGFASAGGGLAVPLLAIWMPVSHSVFLMLPILIAMDMKTIHYYYRHVDWPQVKRLVPAAIAGIIVGGLMLTNLNEQLLRLLLGGLCIAFAFWHRVLGHLGHMRGGAYVWGAASGLTSTLIHAGGPPLNIYMISLNLPKLTWIATTAIFFGVTTSPKSFPMPPAANGKLIM